MVTTMNPARRNTLLIALVLALITGWLVLRFFSGVQAQTNANTRPVQVIVAAQEIPARVPITQNMLALATRPANALDPNAITDPKAVVGALSLITIPQGSSVTSAMIGRPSDVGLTVRLAPGMRAVSVAIDKVKGISGLVQPGDRVDVIAQAQKSGPVPPPAATILRGVRVLAIGEALESSSATPSPEEQNATAVTLEVTPKQADLLVMADLNTTLRLALRSSKEPVTSQPTEALHFDAGIAAPAPAPAAAPVAQAVASEAALLKALAPAPAPASQTHASTAGSSGVQVIDGDHVAGSGSQQ